MNNTEEEQRYTAVNAQIKEQLDAAANDRSPIVTLLRAMLVAEIYTRNETTHQRNCAEEKNSGESDE